MHTYKTEKKENTYIDIISFQIERNNKSDRERKFANTNMIIYSRNYVLQIAV
jgi:hypothetical protein